MRRLMLALTVAGVATTGLVGTAHASPISVCVKAVCVCAAPPGCGDVDPPADIRCVRVDIDDNGTYEEICVREHATV